MDNNEQAIPSDLLAKASKIPSGVKTVDYEPRERIPTLTVGKDFEAGKTIAGYFEESEVLASPKFKYSKTKNEAGVPTSTRHVLRIGSPTGPRLAVWSCGELRVAFEKLTPGSFIAMTYKGKSQNEKGEDQHMFDFQREEAGLNS